MKIVLQRVNRAKVSFEDKSASINKGLLLLFCVEKNDTEACIDYMASKVLNLRVFSDDSGKMNLNVSDIKGEILVVSQFTLAANCSKGTRPSFDNSMEPVCANKMYEEFVSKLKESGLNVQTGKFGAKMEVELVNDGPVTFILEK